VGCGSVRAIATASRIQPFHPVWFHLVPLAYGAAPYYHDAHVENLSNTSDRIIFGNRSECHRDTPGMAWQDLGLACRLSSQR